MAGAGGMAGMAIGAGLAGSGGGGAGGLFMAVLPVFPAIIRVYSPGSDGAGSGTGEPNAAEGLANSPNEGSGGATAEFKAVGGAPTGSASRCSKRVTLAGSAVAAGGAGGGGGSGRKAGSLWTGLRFGAWEPVADNADIRPVTLTELEGGSAGGVALLVGGPNCGSGCHLNCSVGGGGAGAGVKA